MLSSVTRDYKVVTPRLSAIYGNSVQAHTAQHVTNQGKPYSKERIAQALEIINSIREAYARSLVLPDELKHLSPPTTVPGSLDHLRFLVEFVDEDKSILRVSGGYALSYGTTEGYQTKMKARSLDTGVSSALEILEKTGKLPRRAGSGYSHGTGSVLIVSRYKPLATCHYLI